jgi:hypothetical protein
MVCIPIIFYDGFHYHHSRVHDVSNYDRGDAAVYIFSVLETLAARKQFIAQRALAFLIPTNSHGGKTDSKQVSVPASVML